MILKCLTNRDHFCLFESYLLSTKYNILPKIHYFYFQYRSNIPYHYEPCQEFVENCLPLPTTTEHLHEDFDILAFACRVLLHGDTPVG